MFAGLLQTIDGGNVGMTQRGEHARLPLEARYSIRIARKRGRQKLDRNGPCEPRIPRLIHVAHSSGTQVTGNFEVGQSAADQIVFSLFLCGHCVLFRERDRGPRLNTHVE